MKKIISAIAIGGAVGTLTFGNVAQATPFLSVDFESSNPNFNVPLATETGFNSQTVGSLAHATSEGSVTVAVSGQDDFFNRGGTVDSGAFTFGELYSDFVFTNQGASMNFTISGAGIMANTDYQIRFFAFDKAGIGSTATNQITFDPGSDTTGSTGSITYSTLSDPTSNNQYSFLGTWRAVDGSLDIDVNFVSDDLSGFSIARINGLQISKIPEPGTLAILGLGLAGLGFARRRKAA